MRIKLSVVFIFAVILFSTFSVLASVADDTTNDITGLAVSLPEEDRYILPKIRSFILTQLNSCLECFNQRNVNKTAARYF